MLINLFQRWEQNVLEMGRLEKEKGVALCEHSGAWVELPLKPRGFADSCLRDPDSGSAPRTAGAD